MTNQHEWVRKALAAEPTPWVPKKSDTQPRSIVGEIIAIKTRHGDYAPHPDVTVLEADGTTCWSVWMADTSLKDDWEAAAPRVGDVIGVAYRGRKEKKRGDGWYHSWDFTHLPSADAPRSAEAAPAASTSTRVDVAHDVVREPDGDGPDDDTEPPF